MRNFFRFGLICFAAFASYPVVAQENKISVIGYFAGSPQQVDSCAAEKLTHIIFSFCHLKGNQLAVDNAQDSMAIQKLVVLKKRNPELKVLLSLGGWGGCQTCSDVFSSPQGRSEFSQSVLMLSQFFQSDGIDLDWEYPVVDGFPGHKYTADDKNNFTLLVQELRKTLGVDYEISFAAGGFKKYIDEAIDWKSVMIEVDRVHVMTYDLVNGYSVLTGHHTPLYTTTDQFESTDYAIQYLLKLGVPPDKIVIGAAFYGRVWENVPPDNNGLYQPGKFKTSIDFRHFKKLSAQNGYSYNWDDVAKAPFLYNQSQKIFVTYDDSHSIELKTKYVVDNLLGGIMFWEITHDMPDFVLLNSIVNVRKAYTPKK